MTDTTTDDRSDARRFWVDYANGSVLAYYVIARLGQHSSQHSGSVLNDKMDALLQGLDYATTMEEVIAEFVPASQSERGFWKGTYLLFEPGGARSYRLELSDDRAAITIGDEVIEEESADCFSDGRLVLGDDRHAFELKLEFPPSATRSDGRIDLATATTCGQPRCRGRVRTGAGAPWVALEGKRGAFTYAGAQRREDGDPPDTWSGQYKLLFPDDWRWGDEHLLLYVRDGKLAVKLKATRATEVQFINNRFVCSLGGRRLAAELEQRASGKVELAGAFLDGATTTVVTGVRVTNPSATQGGV